ncbi:MAG: hypothetical protein AAFP19_20015 [Bacteroidota bacterium]
MSDKYKLLEEFAALIGGFFGGMVSLNHLGKRLVSFWQALVIIGTACVSAHFLTPLAILFLRLEDIPNLAGPMGFLIGLMSMELTRRLMNIAKQLNLSSILKIPRK